MSRTVLTCIIVAVLVVILAIVILIRRSNKKRYKKLQENIDKMKKQNTQDIDDRITLSSKNEMVDDHFEVNQKVEPKVEDLDSNLEEEKDLQPLSNENQSLEQPMPFAMNTNISHPPQRPKKSQPRVDDFEKFMDEHAYSRKILGKDLRNKLKGLSPQVKALILTNVLNKFDDDKN